jgi:nitrite reductase/ring-hydroxylating ferredoxin subunit
MPDWIPIPKGEEIPAGTMVAVSAAGRRLIVYRCDDRYFATDRRCTHQGADLLKGYFDQEVIECPVHQGRFSVKTGAALSAPACVALQTYRVEMIDGALCVEVG